MATDDTKGRVSGPPTFAEIAEAIVTTPFTNEAPRDDTNIRNVDNRSDHLKRALRNAGGTEMPAAT